MKTVSNNILKPKSQKQLKQYLPKDVINVINSLEDSVSEICQNPDTQFNLEK